MERQFWNELVLGLRGKIQKNLPILKRFSTKANHYHGHHHSICITLIDKVIIQVVCIVIDVVIVIIIVNIRYHQRGNIKRTEIIIMGKMLQIIILHIQYRRSCIVIVQ